MKSSLFSFRFIVCMWKFEYIDTRVSVFICCVNWVDICPLRCFYFAFTHKLTSILGEVTWRRFVASLYLVVGKFDKCVVLFG